MTPAEQAPHPTSAADSGEPRILAFDTATELCSVALLLGNRVLEANALVGRLAGERILPMIDALLREAGVTLRDLEAIAFGRGPGGFTGVRLAASVAQGLAFGAGRPVIPVSDLQALAERGLAHAPDAARVLVCSDARMREVYWALFERGFPGTAEPLGAEQVGAPPTVVLPSDGPATLGVGRGFAVYPELTARLGPRLAGVDGTLLPRATEMVRIAAREWRAGRTLRADQAQPVYLRDEVARLPG